MRVLPLCLLLQDKKVVIYGLEFANFTGGVRSFCYFVGVDGSEQTAGAKPNEEQMVLILDILYMKYFR